DFGEFDALIAVALVDFAVAYATDGEVARACTRAFRIDAQSNDGLLGVIGNDGERDVRQREIASIVAPGLKPDARAGQGLALIRDAPANLAGADRRGQRRLGEEVAVHKIRHALRRRLGESAVGIAVPGLEDDVIR